MANIICKNLVDGELATNYAEFKHESNEDEDKGVLDFDMPIFNIVTEKWESRNVVGFDVQGGEISNQTVEDTAGELSASDRVNPSKVFWWIARKIKSALCPTCM